MIHFVINVDTTPYILTYLLEEGSNFSFDEFNFCFRKFVPSFMVVPDEGPS